jgi:hypothetical protein
MGTNKLTLTPQVVPIHETSAETAEVIKDIMFQTGHLASYASAAFGSHWYVEVPKHLDDLHKEVGEQAVRDVLTKLLDHDTSYEHLWDVILEKRGRQ